MIDRHTGRYDKTTDSLVSGASGARLFKRDIHTTGSEAPFLYHTLSLHCFRSYGNNTGPPSSRDTLQDKRTKSFTVKQRPQYRKRSILEQEYVLSGRTEYVERIVFSAIYAVSVLAPLPSHVDSFGNGGVRVRVPGCQQKLRKRWRVHGLYLLRLLPRLLPSGVSQLRVSYTARQGECVLRRIIGLLN